MPGLAIFESVALLQSALVLVSKFLAHVAQKGAREGWITSIPPLWFISHIQSPVCLSLSHTSLLFSWFTPSFLTETFSVTGTLDSTLTQKWAFSAVLVQIHTSCMGEGTTPVYFWDTSVKTDPVTIQRIPQFGCNWVVCHLQITAIKGHLLCKMGTGPRPIRAAAGRCWCQVGSWPGGSSSHFRPRLELGKGRLVTSSFQVFIVIPYFHTWLTTFPKGMLHNLHSERIECIDWSSKIPVRKLPCFILAADASPALFLLPSHRQDQALCSLKNKLQGRVLDSRG